MARELTKYSGASTGKHLFGDMGSLFKSGYQKLAAVHDGNHGGNVAGSELPGLAIWVDANSNAKVDAGELKSLAEYNIVGFSIFRVHRRIDHGDGRSLVCPSPDLLHAVVLEDTLEVNLAKVCQSSCCCAVNLIARTFLPLESLAIISTGMKSWNWARPPVCRSNKKPLPLSSSVFSCSFSPASTELRQ